MTRPANLLRPSWRKTLTDLLGNKARTILVVASIAVGVFAVGMIAGAYTIIPGDMNASFASANPANIKILTGPFEPDFLEAVRGVDGVLAAEGEQTVNVRLRTGPEDWTSFNLVARSGFEPGRIDSQRPLAGEAAPGENEVILEKKTAEKYHLRPGDRLEIELSDGTRREIPVAGIAQDLTSGIGGLFNRSKGYIQDETLEWLHEPETLSQILVTVAEQPTEHGTIQAVTDRITAKLEKSGRPVYQSEQTERDKHPMDSILQALLRILLILGVLIVFLSGSLISNTLSALLNQHLNQIGIMKLIGARRAQIVRMYLALILSFGLIALVVAVPLGSWAAYYLSSFAAGLIGFPLGGFRVVPQAVLIQVIIALGVPLLAGSLPVLRGSQVTVKKAITATGLSDGQPAKKGRIDRILARLRPRSRPLLVSVRNTFRRKGRLALTLLTLTLGGAIFISVFNVQVSLNQKIEQITHYFGADVNLDFSRSYSIAEVERLALAFPGVSHVEPWVVAQGEMLRPDGDQLDTFALLGPPADSRMVTPVLMQGRWVAVGDQGKLAVNEAFQRRYPELEIGDTLRLRVDGRERDWQIVGIFQFTGVDELIAYTNYDYLARAVGETGKTATYRIASADHSLEFQTRLSRAMDTWFRDRGFKVSSTEAGGSLTRSITEYIGILTAFLMVMALLTAVVGSIGLAGTLGMNVMERTREIGVLRAIGAADRMILKLVLVEGLLIGGISFIIAAMLSFPITAVLAEAISQAIFNTPADFAFTLQGFLVWLGVVLALSTLASLAPAHSASRMTIREVLAYE